MDSEQFERFLKVVDSVAQAMWTLADAETLKLELAGRWFDRKYPEKGGGGDATITEIESEETRLRKSQGQSEETLEEWVGLREQEFDRDQKQGEVQERRGIVAIGDLRGSRRGNA